MDNAVVVSVCRALVASGFVTLRFNFGGVGRSQGTHSGDPEEIADALAATDALSAQLSSGTPRILVGYSYGAWVALQVGSHDPRIERIVAVAPPLNLVDWASLGTMSRPVSVVAAERDQFCAPTDLTRFVRAQGGAVTLHATIAGADHFFWGFEEQAAAACCSASTEPLPG
jgi:alpha/beta superfamily hydrolase